MKQVLQFLLIAFYVVPCASACYAGPTDFEWMVDNSSTILIGEIVGYDKLQQEYRIFVKASGYILEELEKSSMVISCSGIGRSSPPPEGGQYIILLRRNNAGGTEVIAGGMGIFNVTDSRTRQILERTGEIESQTLDSSPMHTLDMYWPPLLVLSLLGSGAFYNLDKSRFREPIYLSLDQFISWSQGSSNKRKTVSGA